MDKGIYNIEAIKAQFRHDFLWISSDQAAAFDDIFKFPFKNIDIIRSGVRHFLIEWGKLADDETQGLNAPYEEMFDIWQRGCENVDRILYWYASIVDELESKGATSCWRHVFLRWAKNPQYMPNYLAQPRFRAFMQLVHKDFTIPHKKFRGSTEGIDAHWISSSDNRTDWDNFLWKYFYEEIFLSPEDYFSGAADNLLLRQFWKKNRNILTIEEQQALYSDFVLELQLMHSNDEAFNWNWVAPIGDAIDIDSIPDFDKYKRDW